MEAQLPMHWVLLLFDYHFLSDKTLKNTCTVGMVLRYILAVLKLTFIWGYTMEPVSVMGELHLTQANDATNDSFSKQLIISNYCISVYFQVGLAASLKIL